MQSFTDVCTGSVYLLPDAKSDAVQATEKYLADVAPYGTVKCIRSDNGAEFTNGEFQTLLRKNKVRQETSCSYSPHQNGTAEREGRTLSRWPDVRLSTVTYLRVFGTTPSQEVEPLL